MTLSNQIIDMHFDVDSIKKKKLEGNEIDFIRKDIKSIRSKKGECRVADLCILYLTKYPKFCRPGDRYGFKNFEEMLGAVPKHFTLYYSDETKTDLCV